MGFGCLLVHLNLYLHNKSKKIGMFSPLLIKVILVVTLLINSVLGFFVYKNNPKSATNIIFTYLSLVTSLWLIVEYLAVFPQVSLIFARLALFFSLPQSSLFFLLAHTLPNEKLQLQKSKLLLLLFLNLFLMLLVVSPYTFKAIIQVGDRLDVAPGIGMLIFLIFVSLLFLFTIYILIKKIHTSQDIQTRRSLVLVLTGMIMMIGLLIFTLVIPVILFQNSYAVRFTPIYTLFFLIPTSIAIIKYQLFNIKILATRVLVGMILLVVFIKLLLSKTSTEWLFNGAIFAIVVFLGILLFRSLRYELEAERAIQEKLKIEALEKQKDEFFAYVGRQFRSLLSGFQEFVHDIAGGVYCQPTKELSNALETVSRDQERMATLLETHLAMTGGDQSAIHCEYEEQNINDCISHVVEELTPTARMKGLHIAWRRNDALPNVFCDYEKIRQVVWNMLDNAIRCTDVGIVRVIAKKDKDRLLVTVADLGIGFTIHDEKKFFEKFSRGGNIERRQSPGMGLGLYISRLFVEAHGGTVFAHSAGPAKGSEFGFWIPFRNADV